MIPEIIGGTIGNGKEQGFNAKWQRRKERREEI
jgi:hypothetical protein